VRIWTKFWLNYLIITNTQELWGKDVISNHDLLPSHQCWGLRGRNIRSEKAPQPGQFFDLLRRIVVLLYDKSAGLPICTTEGRLGEVQHRDVLHEKDRKNGPLWCIRSRNTFYHANPQPFNDLWR
jgi:hypothetical protein